MANPCLITNHDDFRGYPFISYTRIVTEEFQRNNCGSGQTGSYVPYSKSYTSYISESDLETIIIQDRAAFVAEGQSNANANGSCSAVIPPRETLIGSRPRKIVGFDSSYIYGTPVENTGGIYRYPRAIIDAGGVTTGELMHNSKAETIDWFTNVIDPSRLLDVKQLQSGSIMYDTTVTVDYYNTTNPISSPTGTKTIVLPAGRVRTGYVTHFSFRTWTGNPKNGLYLIYPIFNNYSSMEVMFYPDTGGEVNLGIIQATRSLDFIGRPPRFSSNGHNIYITYVSYNNSGYWTYEKGNLEVVRINNDSSEKPVSLTKIYDDYSNQDPITMAACGRGSNFLVFYREGGTRKVLSIIGAAIPNPPNAGSDPIDWAVGDSNIVYCTAGDRSTQSGVTLTRIFRLNANNTWTTLY